MIHRRLMAAAAAFAAALLLPATLGAPAVASNSPTATSDAPGVDIAQTAVATASSVELDQARFAAQLAIDGDPSTRWSSQYADDSWLQLQFAEASPVYSVEIDWPNACARAFSLQTSTDGVSWTTVAERADQQTCPRTDEIVLDVSAPVSYLRMQGAERWGAYGYSISEMRVWSAPPPEPVAQLPLVPQPVSVERHDGRFVLGADARIEADAAAMDAAQLLATTLRPATGFALDVVDTDNAVASAIEIAVAPGLAPEGQSDEGYVLDVDANGVRIGADTAAGALNGVHTLRQLLPAWAASPQRADIAWTVPYVSIADYPRFDYRGLMVDVARSFYTVDDIKQLVDAASALKLNRLHLHLTDDQGWRLAIDTPAANPSGIDYGLLTEVSGATAMTYNASGQLMGTELGHTGFYTQDDYRAIIEYAGSRGMMVVPEIDLPGHTNAALHAIEQLNSAGSSPKPEEGETTPPHQGTGDVGLSSLDADNPATYEFLTTVLRQIAELTPGPYLHIGGDEAFTTSHENYLTMVDFANGLVADLGKTVVGWNEYSSTALPQDNAVVQYWYGGTAPVASAVADHGAQVILSPANRAYYPQRQDPRQPNGGTWACGGACTLENAYSWDPAAQIAGVGEDDVLGVSGAFWGEFIRGVDQAEYFSFPRLLATAEVGWTPQSERNLPEFLQRVGASGPRLALQGVNHFPTATVSWDAAIAPTVTVNRVNGVNGNQHGKGNIALAADIDWRVVVPADLSGEVSGSVTWDDGTVEQVALTAPGVSDIAQMSLQNVYAGHSAHRLPSSRAASGEFTLSVAGDAIATTAFTVGEQVP